MCQLDSGFCFSCSTVRTPVFDRHQFFGTSEHYGKAHGSLLSGWMNYNYAACCWFPTSSNILILPSQFWQIRFESYWLHCSKCRILVLLRYLYIHGTMNKLLDTYRPEEYLNKDFRSVPGWLDLGYMSSASCSQPRECMYYSPLKVIDQLLMAFESVDV